MKRLNKHSREWRFTSISTIEDVISNYYYFVWMNFLEFLSYTVSLKNFMNRSMQRTSVFLLLLFFFIKENYGYCVKENFHTILHSRFYMLLYYVVSYGICAVIFSQLCISTIPHSTYTRVILQSYEVCVKSYFLKKIYVHAISAIFTWDDSTLHACCFLVGD